LSPVFTKDGWGAKRQKFAGWQEHLINFGFKGAFLDEIHYLSNPTSHRSKAVEEIVKAIPNVYGFTGTPFRNRVRDIIHPLRLVKKLDSEFGGYYKFINRYCGAQKIQIGRRYVWDISGASHLEELNERLRGSGSYVRREKAQVLTEIPSLTRSPVLIELSNKREYEKAELNLARWLAEQRAKDKEFLASIRHLVKDDRTRKTLERVHSEEMRLMRYQRLLRFGALGKLSAQGKMKASLEWSQNLLDSGEKLILFAWHKDIQQALFESLNYWNPVKIASGMSLTDKQTSIDLFQTHQQTRCIVIGLGVGKEGIDLFAASNLYFQEFSFTPGDQDQAEARAHRKGQENPVTAHYGIGSDTIDEDRLLLIDNKRIVTAHATTGIPVESQEGVVNALVGRLLKKYKERLNAL
jgi:SWI/SNF-related matrix-associated actin-dependent regulator 1 of chromatin subfamily A